MDARSVLISRSSSRSRRGWRRHSRVLFAVLVVLASACGAHAAAVPAEVQVPIFFKLITYDRTLMGAGEAPIRIGVLGDGTASESEGFGGALAAMVGKTINGRRFQHQRIADLRELEALLAAGALDILYVGSCSACDLAAVTRVTRAHDVLSICASESQIRAGLSIGLKLEDARPRLLVNLQALQEEGHVLDARVLRLCEVVDT